MKNTQNSESTERINALKEIAGMSDKEYTNEEIQKYIDSQPIETQKIIEQELKENNK